MATTVTSLYMKTATNVMKVLVTEWSVILGKVYDNDNHEDYDHDVCNIRPVA